MNLTLHPVDAKEPFPPKIDLAKSDYMAEGGEAIIYAKGDLVFRVYRDPSRVIPLQKIEELAALERKEILRPLGYIKESGKIAGTFLKKAPKSCQLANLISSDYRGRHHVTQNQVLAIIEQLRELLSFIHEKGCLVPDGSEMNYLVEEQSYKTPYCIDVDSYQTPHFPATAILPLVKDYHAKKFSELTDWFSFGIVACSLLLGIHPFKGQHPRYKGKSAVERMRANASVFDRGVVLPPAAGKISDIPDSYREWFIQLFQEGKRSAAPLLKAISPVLIEKREEMAKLWSLSTKLGKVDVSLKNDRLYIDGVQTLIAGQSMYVHENTPYVLFHDRFMEVILSVFGQKVLASPGKVWQVLPHATEIFEGLVYQNIYGVPHLISPPIYEKIPELSGQKIIDGKRMGNLIELIIVRKGEYDRAQINFHPNGPYSFIIEKDVGYS